MGNPHSHDPDSAQPQGDSGVVEETRQKLQKPKMYKVLLVNDDYTTMDFVVMVLTSVFRRSPEEAVRIMMQVHRMGSGVAGVYTFEVAETKARKVVDLARANDFPLQCSVEPA